MSCSVAGSEVASTAAAAAAAAPGAESASDDGSSSDLSASTVGTNGGDKNRNSGGEESRGTSLATVEVAFKAALIGLLKHQVGMLKEHRIDELTSQARDENPRDAAENYVANYPFLIASIQVGLLLAYVFTGVGYYIKILFGFALLMLAVDQATQLYRQVKNPFAAGDGRYSKRGYFFLFLVLCAITPTLVIFYKAGFNLWLLAVPSVAYNALRRTTRFIAEKKGYNPFETYRGVLFAASLAMLGVRFFIYDDKYSRGDIFVIFFGIIALTGFAFTPDSEEFMLFCLVGGTTTAAIGINILIDHPCTICAWESYENAQPIFYEYFGSSAAKPISQMWRIIFDDDGYGIPQECGTCFETVSALHRAAQGTTKPFRDSYGSAVGAYEYFFGESDDVSLPDSVAEIEVGDFENDITSDNLRKWNQWYDKLLDEEKVSLTNIESLFVAFASNITTCDGQEKLNEAVHNMMCNPTSRASGGPSPSEFLMQIQQPKFTGEASETGKPMNLSMNELKRIIRADNMIKLGSPTCFMQNFVNVISPNLNVENEIMDPSNIAPIATETELKGEDISFLFPALYVPRTDEDRDPTGEGGDITEGAFTLYRQLPMIDPDHIFFKSKEEYIAWFRWNIEHKLQEEFYFPRWLSNGIESTHNEDIYDQKEVASIRKRLIKESGEIRSMQFEYRADRLSLTDASSDATLSDRAFFGSGSKRMARIQLPGDEKYGFLLDSSYYDTQAERDTFDLTSSMPKEYHFEQMANHFWGGKDVPLKKLRKKLYRRVVQVDYMEISLIDTRESFERNGSILYLDVVTRKPMGIWLANTKQLVLPSQDPLFCEQNPGSSHECPWEHAKFIHRCTELTLIAMRHAGEYHIGYANVLSTAIRQTLPESHPLRAFLKPYTHGTGIVDWVANNMLLQDRSVLHRASGMTRKARGYAFATFQKHMNYTETLPAELKAKNLDGMASTITKKKPSFFSTLWKRDDITDVMPMFDAAMRNWEIHRSFVEKYLRVVYPSDADLTSDTALHRFVMHLDTWGRHMDPCVCKMNSEAFFEEGQWPAFETTKTCSALLDFAAEGIGGAYAQRREQWCKRASNERKNILHKWLESECVAKQKGVLKTEWCSTGGCQERVMGLEEQDEEECLSYGAHFIRSDMGLPSTIDRSTLVDVFTKFIYEVTLGHEMAADNIPYVADPSYGGVRISKNITARGGEILVDFATYIYGNVVAAATTIRSMPLLADWSELLVHWVDMYKEKEWGDDKRQELKKKIRMVHLQYKADLVHLSNELMKQTLKKPKNEWAPYLNPATQASSVAV